eukprot:11197370-Lingulodinium_polyedra.AAC.1
MLAAPNSGAAQKQQITQGLELPTLAKRLPHLWVGSRAETATIRNTDDGRWDAELQMARSGARTWDTRQTTVC